MSIGFTELMIIAIVAVLFFGRGKVSELMGDVAKGIKSFKKGIAEDETPPAAIEHKVLENPASTASGAASDRRLPTI